MDELDDRYVRPVKTANEWTKDLVDEMIVLLEQGETHERALLTAYKTLMVIEEL
jgi:hypothetical protein